MSTDYIDSLHADAMATKAAKAAEPEAKYVEAAREWFESNPTMRGSFGNMQHKWVMAHIINPLADLLSATAREAAEVATKAERERAMRILFAARNAEIDTDLRSLIHRVKSGSPFPDAGRGEA